MKHTHTTAKLFLTAGALCSLVAFSLIIVSDTPWVQQFVVARQKHAIAAVATVGNVPEGEHVTTQDVAAIAVLSTDDLARVVGHVPTEREVIADVNVMKITVLEGPAVIAEYPILSIGKPGTFWETPAGDYAIKTKEPKHLSSIGGTWMPWSMQFYGNFFIHGWPTYPDGTPVPRGYSGGCIRLSTEDAEALYGLVRIGTHVHVRGATAQQGAETPSYFYMKDVGEPPRVTALAYSVFDIETGQVLWSRGLDVRAHPSRLTALMTALVSVETIDQYTYINFEALLAGKNPSRGKPSSPSSVQVGALLYPLLFDANDMAARALEELRGKTVFRNYMNEKAAAIGMQDTIWAGATSFADSVTTARDMSRLLSYVDKQKNFLMKTTVAEQRSFEYEGEVRFSWKNRNVWVKDVTFLGGVLSKDVHEDGSAVAVYSLPMSEFGSRKIGFVLLGALNVEGQIDLMKTYVGSHFFYGPISQAEGEYADSTDTHADAERLKKIKEMLVN